MSRMQCKCGASIGTSECPSPYSLAVYYEKEIQDALSYDPEIQLRNFLLDWDEKTDQPKAFMQRKEPVHYMYCIECRRVYEVQLGPYGRWLRLYRRTERENEGASIEGWKRIYVFPEVTTDAATELNMELLLSDYLKQNEDIVYLISDDEETICAVDRVSNEIRFTYVLEDTQESEK